MLASRGASGIDGLVSSATGAALAHQAAGGGPAAALLGDLAFLHDAPGLFAGPEEARPDLVLVVANNDGGGIFSTLEQAAVPAPFERVFGTPHRARLAGLAAAAGIGHIVRHPGGRPAGRAQGRRDPYRRGARGPGGRDGAAAAAGRGRGAGGHGAALAARWPRRPAAQAVPGAGGSIKENFRRTTSFAMIFFAAAAAGPRLCALTGETGLMWTAVNSIPDRPDMRHREGSGSGLIRVRLPSGHDSEPPASCLFKVGEHRS